VIIAPFQGNQCFCCFSFVKLILPFFEMLKVFASAGYLITSSPMSTDLNRLFCPFFPVAVEAFFLFCNYNARSANSITGFNISSLVSLIFMNCKTSMVPEFLCQWSFVLSCDDVTFFIKEHVFLG
jgi:hypothetical protein